jgi:hypothetical protein
VSEIIKKTSSRIFTFDIMRGYFLAVILFNHLQYYPSGLEIFTGRGMLYASTAEGFFAVSGIVLGIIRGRKLLQAPFKKAASMLVKRGSQLYLTSIALTVLFTFIGTFFVSSAGLKYGIYTNWGNIFELIWKTITLQYSYGWADFLRFYAIFMIASPFALWLLRQGLWYVLLAANFVVWLLFPFSPFPPEISQPISWQVIFFGAFTIGFYWPLLVEKWNILSNKIQRTIGVALVSLAALTMATSVVLVFGHSLGGSIGNILDTTHHMVELFFNKDRMPYTRIALGIVWFWAIFYVIRKNEARILKRIGWLLVPLGENSLYVYTIQAFIVFFFHLFVVLPGGTGNIVTNLMVSLLAFSLVYIAVRKKFLMKIIPR